MYCVSSFNWPSTVSSVLQRSSSSTVTITARIDTVSYVATPTETDVGYTTSITLTVSSYEAIVAPTFEVRYRDNDTVILSLLASLNPTNASRNATSSNSS